MAKIFLDTNTYIDLIKKRTDLELEDYDGHELYVSPLAIHVLIYVYKYIVPDSELQAITELFNIVPITVAVTEKSLVGPSVDFEDNIHLHSASEADCDFFVTRDKKLSDMKFFGRIQIIRPGNF